jgi:protocatechuate 3,4-dioxygenase beta subunit
MMLPEADEMKRGTVKEAATGLSRRKMLGLIGATAAASLMEGMSGRSALAKTAGAETAGTPSETPARTGTPAPPACVVRPEQMEGPYFVDERLNRSDIRSDPSDGTVKEGTPLRLVFRVSRIEGRACAPLAGALVDVWQCDALGVYSDVLDPRFDTRGKRFLRGYQVTDQSGTARFVTVYPGWYPGRTVHIHFKIRTGPASGRGYEFTSQLYFDDALTDRVHAQAPYAARGPRTVRNHQDGIFRRGGERLILPVVQDENGYLATFDIGLQIA